MRYAIRAQIPYMAVTWSYSRHRIDLDCVSQHRLWQPLQLDAKPETPTDTRGQLGSVIQLARDVPKDFLFFYLIFWPGCIIGIPAVPRGQRQPVELGTRECRLKGLAISCSQVCPILPRILWPVPVTLFWIPGTA